MKAIRCSFKTPEKPERNSSASVQCRKLVTCDHYHTPGACTWFHKILILLLNQMLPICEIEAIRGRTKTRGHPAACYREQVRYPDKKPCTLFAYHLPSSGPETLSGGLLRDKTNCQKHIGSYGQDNANILIHKKNANKKTSS